MKKQLFMILVGAALASNSSGQPVDRNELRVGVGWQSTEMAAYEVALNTFSVLFLQERSRAYPRSNGIYVTYKRRSSRKFALGFASGLTFNKTEKGLFNSDWKTQVYDYAGAMVAVEPTFTYMENATVSLYAVTGLGGVFIFDRRNPATNEKRTPFVTLQLTPIGIRYGRKVGAFAELGYGYKGIVNFGISTKF